MADLYRENVALNMRFEGVNNSTSFTDDCENIFIPYGNAKISNAKFKYETSSGYLDGNISYVYLSGNPIFNFGYDDFTIEAYVYLLAMPTSDNWPGAWSSCMVICGTGTPGDGFDFLIGQTKLMAMSNDPQVFSANHGMSANKWYHVAICRQSNVLYGFVDGVLIGTSTWTGVAGGGSGTYIGCETGQGAWFNGYIDNLRVTKKVARYTSNFTPVQIDTISRIQYDGELYKSNVVLNMRMEGNNLSNVFIDDIGNYPVSTNAVLTTDRSKYGTTSAYFNGSSYVNIPSSTGLNMSNGDFTIEFWCYCMDQLVTTSGYISNNSGTWASGAFAIGYDNTGKESKYVIYWYDVNLSSAIITSKDTFSFNQWRHIALSRDGTIVRLFVDGAIQSSISITADITLDLGFNGSLNLGRNTWNGANGYATDYIDELRITKGVCRYKNNFIPNRIGGYKTLSGVVNNPNGLPIQNALIRLYSNSDGNLIKSTYSNIAGQYSFSGLWAGDYYISSHYDGYPNIISNQKITIV